MARQNQSIDRFLNDVQVILDNIRKSPDIQTALVEYGYDEVRLDEGAALKVTLQAQHTAQKQAYGAQFAATWAAYAAWKAADVTYTKHRRLMGIAVRYNKGRRHALGLNQRKQYTQEKWRGQAVQFYDSVLKDDDAIADVALFKVTQEELVQGQARLGVESRKFVKIA